MYGIIKTIKIFGNFTVNLQNAFFAEQDYYTYRHNMPVLGVLRRPVGAWLFVVVVALLAFVVLLLYSIVSNEYDIRRFTRDISREENQLSRVLIEHASLSSSGEILRLLSADAHGELVQIGEISYIKPGVVLQANAQAQFNVQR